MKNRKEEEPKQVIVIRKDLNMPPGKLSAQVSHASMGAVFSKMKRKEKAEENKVVYELDLDLVDEMDKALELWLSGRFTKIVVYVKSEEKLLNIFKKAEELGLPCALIKDSGFTFFKEPTNTCLGIGPCFPKDFVGVTDNLRLY